MDLKAHIREIPDFPKPGILFYDISTLLQRPDAFQVAIDRMADLVAPYRPARLVGIELPWVDIEHERRFVGSIDRAQSPTRKPIWKLPEVSASADYEARAEHRNRGHGYFENAGCRVDCDSVRPRRGRRQAVQVVMNRRDARVVDEARLGDDLESPE